MRRERASLPCRPPIGPGSSLSVALPALSDPEHELQDRMRTVFATRNLRQSIDMVISRPRCPATKLCHADLSIGDRQALQRERARRAAGRTGRARFVCRLAADRREIPPSIFRSDQFDAGAAQLKGVHFDRARSNGSNAIRMSRFSAFTKAGSCRTRRVFSDDRIGNLKS